MKLLDTVKTSLSFATALLIITSFTSCATEPYSFNDWDYDDDLYLDEDEFYSGLGDLGYYDMWDYNGDDYLTEDEWNEGVDQYLGAYDPDDYGDFSEWDDDDERLSEDEFETNIFDTADLNDDDQVDEEELDTWYDDDLD